MQFRISRNLSIRLSLFNGRGYKHDRKVGAILHCVRPWEESMPVPKIIPILNENINQESPGVEPNLLHPTRTYVLDVASLTSIRRRYDIIHYTNLMIPCNDAQTGRRWAK